VGNDIPVLEYTENAAGDPLWTTFFGHLVHPDYSHPVFFRHNGSNVDLFNLYNGGTVYLIGRGPSLKKFVENGKIRSMLQHPAIVTYGMNTSPEVLNYDVNIWSCVDSIMKFPKQIAKNPNIMKLIPMNRFKNHNFDCRTKDDRRTLAYQEGSKKVYAGLLPNIFGVQTFLISQDSVKHITFGNAFLSCPAVLYGYYKGHKCVFLFALKLCLLLGFKRIVLIGIDFKMDKNEPYYKNTADDYNEFHVQHNNRLYDALSPLIQEIFTLLKKKKSQYRCNIVTANPIEALPFIPVVKLSEILQEDIERRTK